MDRVHRDELSRPAQKYPAEAAEDATALDFLSRDKPSKGAKASPVLKAPTARTAGLAKTSKEHEHTKRSAWNRLHTLNSRRVGRYED